MFFPQFVNNETFALPTGFKADLRVDPPSRRQHHHRDGNGRIRRPRRGRHRRARRVPFQVRCTGGTNIRTVNFELYNIRAIDNSWTGGSGCSAGNLKFTRVANANFAKNASFAGFPESFDTAVPPSTSWVIVDVVGTLGNWARSTATSSPTGGTPTAAPGWPSSTPTTSQRRADPPPADGGRQHFRIPLVGASLWMYHETQYSAYLDYVQMQVATDGTAPLGPTPARNSTGRTSTAAPTRPGRSPSRTSRPRLVARPPSGSGSWA